MPISTLRYYDKEGLFPGMERQSGIRRFGEREIEALYKAVYLSRRVGEECEATVSSCTAFGMFCELDNTCEGLVPIDDLDGNFVFDEGNLSLRSGDTVYRIGDRVRVVIEEVSVSHRKVRFSVAGENRQTPPYR